MAEKFSIKLIHLSYENSKTFKKNQLFEIFSIAYHQGQNMEFIEKLRPKYIQLGPVFKTKTHPLRNDIGIENCKDLYIKIKNYKYIAVGGINLKNISHVLESGFQLCSFKNKILEY